MGHPSIFRVPRPRSFFYITSLRVGAQLITLTLLINKVSGLYGILALFTGAPISGLQLSMYIYSLVALIIAFYLAQYIRLGTPLQCIALAWLYLLDSIINAAYTLAFGMSYFLVLARHTSPLANTPAPPTNGVGDNVGFTSPTYNVSHVEVVAGEGFYGSISTAPAGANTGNALTAAILESGSIASVTIVSLLWAIRVYAAIVLFAYARSCLRIHIANAAISNPTLASESAQDNNTDGLALSPFAKSAPHGAGWPGTVGRAMTCISPAYWLGPDDDGDAMRALELGGRKERRVADERPFERERRRRAGTGPPPAAMATGLGMSPAKVGVTGEEGVPMLAANPSPNSKAQREGSRTR